MERHPIKPAKGILPGHSRSFCNGSFQEWNRQPPQGPPQVMKSGIFTQLRDGHLHDQKQANNWTNFGKIFGLSQKCCLRISNFIKFAFLSSYLENYLITKLISNYLLLCRKVRPWPNTFGRGCQMNCKKLSSQPLKYESYSSISFLGPKTQLGWVSA